MDYGRQALSARSNKIIPAYLCYAGIFFVELRTKAFELENNVMDDNANKIPNIINGMTSAFSIEKSRRRIFSIIAK